MSADYRLGRWGKDGRPLGWLLGPCTAFSWCRLSAACAGFLTLNSFLKTNLLGLCGSSFSPQYGVPLWSRDQGQGPQHRGGVGGAPNRGPSRAGDWTNWPCFHRILLRVSIPGPQSQGNMRKGATLRGPAPGEMVPLLPVPMAPLTCLDVPGAAQTPALGWCWGDCLMGCRDLLARAQPSCTQWFPSTPPIPEEDDASFHQADVATELERVKALCMSPHSPGSAPLAHVGLREMTRSGPAQGWGWVRAGTVH